MKLGSVMLSYILECRVLENVENMKCLSVTIIDDLKCNICVSAMFAIKVKSMQNNHMEGSGSATIK